MLLRRFEKHKQLLFVWCWLHQILLVLSIRSVLSFNAQLLSDSYDHLSDSYGEERALLCLFKHAMEISPHQYVIQQRVERARLMLSKTDLAIADIALQVGFSRRSHLTQYFKRSSGMTPKQVG